MKTNREKTDLLSAQYEKRIKELEDENKRLKHYINFNQFIYDTDQNIIKTLMNFIDRNLDRLKNDAKNLISYEPLLS